MTAEHLVTRRPGIRASFGLGLGLLACWFVPSPSLGDSPANRAAAAPPSAVERGAPSLEGAGDAGEGRLRLTWSNAWLTPSQYLGFAYDIYAEDWASEGWNGTLWHPLPAWTTSGTLELAHSGAYHAWISSQYADGDWRPCDNPWTGIVYGGVPHTPRGVSAERRGGAPNVRLSWKPDLYGTWLYEIIAYKDGQGFVETNGPSGFGLWHFVDYGGTAHGAGLADFLEGWADFSLPPGSYWLFVRGVGWQAPYPAGEYGAANAIVTAPDPLNVNLPSSATLTLLPIFAGRFQMGSPWSERHRWCDEGPVRSVAINHDFYLGECEITQRQWLAVMGGWPDEPTSPTCGQGDDYPAYFVSWHDCQNFIAALNAHVANTGQGPATFRLPTEAEWEYACRAGTQTRFFFGDSLEADDYNQDGPAGALPGNRSDYMWWWFNCQGNNNGSYGCKPVGVKLPNQFGLYDMSGNVFEWCQDWYHTDYRGAPEDGSAWDTPQVNWPYRVARGGSWAGNARSCRSACREYLDPGWRADNVGLRLARTVN